MEALGAPPSGRAAVVILGEAGIGKSTVFEAITDNVRPRLWIRASEREQALAYAALGDLIGPHFERLGSRLAPARRAAIVGALQLGEVGDPVPDSRIVAFATGELLAVLAEEGPLVIAIDDAQWLDRESASCLTFAARRLARLGVALLVSGRTGADEGIPLGLDELPTGAEIITLGPLPMGPLGQILAQHLGRALPLPTLMHIHNLSHGNPLLALELGRLQPPDAPPDALPVAPEIERLIGRRIRDLSARTIDLLLLAAASRHPTVDLLAMTTAAPSGEVASLLGPRAADGLIDISDGVVEFAHPLFRSAVLRSVSPGARAGAHARLAAVTTGAEQALHLADSASGPDEDVAAHVERAGDDAARGGATSTAAILFERAAALSPDPYESSRRSLGASAFHRAAGDATRADNLAERAIAQLPPCVLRAKAQASLFMPQVTDEELAAVVREAGDDHAAVAFIYDRHAEAAFLRLDLRASVESSKSAVAAAERAGDETLLAPMLAGLGGTLGLMEPGAGFPWLERAAGLQATPLGYPSAASWIAGFQKCADDLDSARAGLRAVAEQCQQAGNELGRSACLMHLVEVETRAGNLREARALATAHTELSAGLGSWQAPYLVDYVQSLVLAYEGIGDQASLVARRGLAMAEAAGDWAFAIEIRFAAGLGCLAGGAFEEAADLLSAARRTRDDSGFGEVGVVPLDTDEIEASLGAGRLDDALEMARRLGAVAQRLGRPRLLGGALVSSGLCLAASGSSSDGIAKLDEGVDTFLRAGLRWDHSRALLSLGTVLRRCRQWGRARAVLAEAVRGFTDLGAPGWAIRALDEGSRISGRGPGGDAPTPTEARIIELVSTGLSNRQIAEHLFMSTKTVEGHLSHIFQKLGVHGRTELAARTRGTS